MKKYIAACLLLLIGSEAVSIAAITVIITMALCDMARAAEKKGV